MNRTITIDQIVEKMNLKVLTSSPDKMEVNAGYCCDMLSWVISHLESNACWFTILSSMNVIAVASLSDCPMVVITESSGVLDADVIEKANAEQICLCATEKNSFVAGAELARLLELEP